MPKIQGQQMKRSYKNILCVNKVACHDVKKLRLISNPAHMSLNSEVLVAHYFCNISPESKILNLTNNFDLRFLNASRRWAGGFKGFLFFSQ